MTYGQGLLCAFVLFNSFVAENCNDAIKSRIYMSITAQRRQVLIPMNFYQPVGTT